MSLVYVQKRFMSSALQKFVYNMSGFNKYGLMRDDILDESRKDVQEALKRLDEKTIDERNYRLIRAAQLSLQKIVLPKDQWTKFEEDKMYLTPLIKQIRKEWEEMEEWNKKY
ncbi:cytochrome b-c1 complex subunit 7-like [Coccinella septempunctata]|uniref:cytochrome b-c1 complex subunit 7-like n=1 Tax=Coccinella septempunctata TaxID=41139 RepID=UPI001D076D77|nr:cytochrome b-c1 complex subunit 7-like [Coccinella septempunctata]